MGDYNFYAPQILGEEWVSIRDEDQIYSPAVNAVETGHGFTVATSRVVDNGRFYVKNLPPAQTQGQVYEIGIYPAGRESLSGPIGSVTIPCNSGGVTGTGFAGLTAANIPIFLASSADNSWVECTPNADANPKTLDLFFATNAYAQILNGKRILGVNLLHSFSWQPFQAGVAGSVASTTVQFTSPQALEIWTGAGTTRAAVFAPVVETYGSNLLALDPPQGRPPQAIPMSVVRFGEVNHFWQTPSTTITSDRVPWRYTELQRFEATSGSNRYRVHYDFGGTSAWAGVFYLNYAALQVVYCEEQRVAWGLTSFNDSFAGSNAKISFGVNTVTMRDTSLTAAPSLAAGAYTAALSCPDIGDLQGAQGSQESQPAAANTYATLNAVRELYQIPPHPGVQVNIPSPPEDHIGDVFTQTVTHVLPQISLHASGGVLTEPHAYGRQVAAQVWGTNTATQDIYDDISGIAASYPQVRFYARRFGDTSVPLKLTGVGGLSASTVSITPDEFDLLPEIVDGWAEVTLRFGTAPSMGAVAGNPAWTWSATSELSGNRWEVLGACAPAISGTPGNLFNLATQQLGTATYQPPSGNTVELTWMPQGVGSPWVSGASIDATTDAVLLFSQDPPTVTGVSLSQLSQTVTGIGLNCGSLPCCIPSGIGYQRVTWATPQVVYDLFDRTVVNGWGNTTSGLTWLNDVPDADYDVAAGVGTVQPSILADGYNTWTDVGSTDIDVQAEFQLNALPASGTVRFGLIGRFTDGDNTYIGYASIATTGVVTLTLAKRVATVETVIASVVLPYPLLIATSYTVELLITATTLRLRMWKTADNMPGYQLATTDTSLATGSNAGVYVRNDTAVTTHVFSVDNYQASPPAFGAYELQRYDSVTGVFETIMLSTTPTTAGFNDFEARVGIDSVYRLRMLNIYNFAGAWSTQVTGAPPTPGVTGGCSDNTGALIFTSNADQSGLSNAAYVMQWDGNPEETFSLPEGDSVTYLEMYDRDGRVAFHGTERGLESLSRTVLLNAAAIAPARLADATTIRDLAWRDLPYVCVRDDIGDRWYANVRVPAVSATQNRTNYLARLDIIELTRTPAQVNP